MKKYSRLFKYLRFYKKNIVLYFIFTILSIVFSLVSLGTLPLFLRLIFDKDNLVLTAPNGINNSDDLFQYMNYQISQLVISNGAEGPFIALAYICLLVIISVLLKNAFL